MRYPCLLLVALWALLVRLPAGAAPPAPLPPHPLPLRWFHAFGFNRQPDQVARLKTVIDTAAANGYNGVVLPFGFDAISKWTETDYAALREVVAHCAERQVELIPSGFAVGHAGASIGCDRNLSAALPVILFLEAREGRIYPAASPNLVANPGLEVHQRQRLADFTIQDGPGTVSFADPDTKCEGQYALRFANLGAADHGNARLAQAVRIRPRHHYRFTCRVKTQDLQPSANFNLMMMGPQGRVALFEPNLAPTQDWTTLTLDFISQDEERITLYAGLWEGRSGTYWLDDWQFREVNELSDLVRREGTHLAIHSRERDVTFTEGQDYEPVVCQEALPSLALPPGTAIRAGEPLILTGYRLASMRHAWGLQYSLCMSNPGVYDHWATQAGLLYRAYPFKRYFLHVSEIRNGGGCALCRQRKLSLAEMLGDCVTRQRAILKALEPNVELFIWADMFDPAHNARNRYYRAVGDFSDAWRYLPQDLTVVCWNEKLRRKTLPFFAKQGFPTLAAAYYDSGNLDATRDWLNLVRQTPGARGLMYTTWQNQYELLPATGQLLLAPPPAAP
jgi:hypothetical protein